jgi:hypothetical protein
MMDLTMIQQQKQQSMTHGVIAKAENSTAMILEKRSMRILVIVPTKNLLMQ